MDTTFYNAVLYKHYIYDFIAISIARSNEFIDLNVAR